MQTVEHGTVVVDVFFEVFEIVGVTVFVGCGFKQIVLSARDGVHGEGTILLIYTAYAVSSRHDFDSGVSINRSTSRFRLYVSKTVTLIIQSVYSVLH